MRMRAASVSVVSSSLTGTPRCTMMGPPSSVSSTKCTVQPLNLTPCAMAWHCASNPGKAGKRLGWMLRMRARYAVVKAGESSRMKPARQMSSTPRSVRAAAISCSCSARVRPRRSITSVSKLRATACCKPAAFARSLITTAIAASGICPARMALARATMFDPRPEMRIASFKVGRSRFLSGLKFRRSC